MKKLLLVGTALTVLFGGSALAADLRRPAYTPPPPPPPVFSWTGFYIGGNLGGAWARGSVNDSLFGLSASSDRSGFIGGGQVGVNYQFSNIVLGAEWDFDWTSLDATGNGRFVPGVGTLQGSANTRWISTLAARFGVVLNNGVLLYGKAGGAWVDNNATITNLNTGASISASNRNSGWVVGGGVEWAIAGNWSAKLEYDFVQLDDLTFGPGPFLGNTFTASREIQMFKVGLNYRFGSLFGGGYGGVLLTGDLVGERDPQKPTRERREPWVPRGFFFFEQRYSGRASKSLPSPVRSCKQSRMRCRPKAKKSARRSSVASAGIAGAVLRAIGARFLRLSD